MTDKDRPPSELPLPCVLDDDDIDRLLERLRAVHGEPRQDIAPGLNRQGRARKAAQVSAAQNLARGSGELRQPA